MNSVRLNVTCLKYERFTPSSWKDRGYFTVKMHKMILKVKGSDFLTETTGEILQTSLRSYLKTELLKNVSSVSNSKVFLYNTALSAQNY